MKLYTTTNGELKTLHLETELPKTDNLTVREDWLQKALTFRGKVVFKYGNLEGEVLMIERADEEAREFLLHLLTPDGVRTEIGVEILQCPECHCAVDKCPGAVNGITPLYFGTGCGFCEGLFPDE